MHARSRSPSAQSAGTRGSREDEEPGAPLRGQKILIVEDDPFIAMHLECMLNAAGASVLGPAHDLSGALSLLESSEICAAVLDYRLQAGNTRLLARLLARRGIPFLFQTSDPASAKREHPTTPIIAKPFPTNRLISALQALLVGRSEAKS
jgi:DNA-binding response OmpR family regulator